MCKENKFDRVVSALRTKVELSTKALDEFKVKLENNPAHAFRWSSAAFEAAAMLHVCQDILQDVELARKQNRMDGFIDYLTRRCESAVYRQVRYASRSTSLTGDYMDQCEAVAYAQLAEVLATIRPR